MKTRCSPRPPNSLTCLKEFGVRGRVKEVRPGPVITLFEMEPAPGVKSSRVISLADDIARSMSAKSARVAVVPGKNAIGIELPNEDRDTVYLRTLLQSDAYTGSRASLPMALGEDIGGVPTVVDLAKMPHLLIAGTTGSGKSVGCERNDPVTDLPPYAGTVPFHHDRPENARALDL